MNTLAPLLATGIIPAGLGFLTFFVIGIFFGFVLEQAGFSSSKNLAGVFYGYDTRVLKTFFTAAVISALGITYLQRFGIINPDLINWHPTFIWGVIIGAIVMGIGFIVGGFCPGTSICAASIGKIDAFVFVTGLFIGMILFGHYYGYFQWIHKYSIGIINAYDFLNISQEAFMLVLSILAAGAFWLAEFFEKKVTGMSSSSKPRIITSCVLVGLALVLFIF